MHKKLLETKLNEIDEAISANYNIVENIGVLSGLSGIAIFKFYLSKHLKSHEHSEFGVMLIESIFDKINEGYQYPTFCSGIAGSSWAINHLMKEGFIDIQGDHILAEFDDYLFSCMKRDIESGNYDFLHGAIGYAFYFSSRLTVCKSVKLKKKYESYLIHFLHFLKESAETINGSELRWASEGKSKEKIYNLSLSHGMSSIVGILTNLAKYKFCRKLAKFLLKGAILFIENSMSTNLNSFSLFPSYIENDYKAIYRSRVAWCYGDLGIALMFWHASKILKDSNLQIKAITIFKHASKRSDPALSLVVDAGICHGSFGNAQIFHRISNETKYDQFQKTSALWIKNGLNQDHHQNGFAGYKQWKKIQNGWVPELSLLEGVAGIGLTIIDSISNFETNWDECLMLS